MEGAWGAWGATPSPHPMTFLTLPPSKLMQSPWGIPLGMWALKTEAPQLKNTPPH